MRPSYYQILRVPLDADRATLRAAFRARARNRHPDHGGSHEQMLELIEAWEVLSDPVARREYDIGLKHPTDVNRGAADPTDAARARAHRMAEEYPRSASAFQAWLTAFDRELQSGEFMKSDGASDPEEAARSDRQYGAIWFAAGILVVIGALFSTADSSRMDSIEQEVAGLIAIVGGAVLFLFAGFRRRTSHSRYQPGSGIRCWMAFVVVLLLVSVIVFLVAPEKSLWRVRILACWFIAIIAVVTSAFGAWRGGSR